MNLAKLSWSKWGAGIILCAWLGQHLLAMAVPGFVMEVLYKRVSEQYGVNTLAARKAPF